LSKTKVIALSGLLALAAAGVACTSSGVGEKTASGNTNKPTTPAPTATTPTTPAPTATVAGLEGPSAKTYEEKCSGCHGADAKGSKGAPSILEVKDSHSSAEWQAYLKNTKIWDKNNRMPVIPLDEAQLKQMGDWLAATTGKGAKTETAAPDKGAKTEGAKKS